MQIALQNTKQQSDLVQYLIENFYTSDTDIAQAIAQDLSLPLMDLDAFDFKTMYSDNLNEILMVKHYFLPLFIKNERLYITTSNPTQPAFLDKLKQHYRFDIECIVVEFHKLQNALQRLFTNQFIQTQDDEINLDLEIVHQNENIEDNQQDVTPIVKYVNKLLLDAIKMGASDLYFEPYEKLYRVRYRIDGLLRQIATPPPQLAHRIASRIKVMAQMDIAEKRIPQDGRIKLKVSDQQHIDFRVSTLPTLSSEKLVLRILNSSNQILDINQLGLENEQKQLFLD